VTNQKTLTEYPEGIKESSIESCLEYFKEHEVIACDSETEGLDPIKHKIITFQIGDEDNQYVIDCYTVDIRIFKELLETKTTIFQNAKFDLGFLYSVGIVPTKVKDTFLAECVLHTGDKIVRKGLYDLVLRQFGVELDKSIRGNIKDEGLTTEVIIYAADDVKYLIPIIEKQEKDLRAEDLFKVYVLENEMVRVVAYVEHCGFKINIPKWKKKMLEDSQKRKNAEDILNSWVIKNMPKYTKSVVQLDLFDESHDTECDILWSSSKQVIPLMEDLGVNTFTFDSRTKRMRNSIEEDVIKPQSDVTPLIDLFLEFQSCAKVVSTYGDNILKQIHPDGRLRTRFTQIMNTGRMSSGGGDRKMKVKFTNFQNIPRVPEKKHRKKEVYERECFTCEPGNNLIVSDYTGQEQIVFANFSLDSKILEFYDKGFKDMHSFVASKMFKELSTLPLEEIKKNHAEKRYIAKTAGFAMLYGGSAGTLSRNLSIPFVEAEEIYNSYFSAFPGVKNYFKKVAKKALSAGHIKHNTILGRKTRIIFYDEYKRKLQKLDDEYWKTYREEKAANSDLYKETLKKEVREFFQDQGRIERMSYNYPIQGSSADITKIACVRLFKYLEKNDLLFKVLMPSIIHDEIVLECSEEMSEEMSKVLKDCMVKAGEYYCKRVPLTAVPMVTKVWEH
jgi:DNA polymerase-1